MWTSTALKMLTVFGYISTATAQCPTFDVTDEWYSTSENCGNPNDPVTDCNGNDQTNYSSVLFYTDGSEETLIEVVGSTYYTFTYTGILWSHLLLFDGCGGDLIWGTFNCAPWDLTVWSTGVMPMNMDASYTVALDLPEGEYLLLFGYLGIPQVQNLMAGCVSVTIGTPFFLNYEPEQPEEQEAKEEKPKVKYPRKVVHPVYGYCLEIEEGKYMNYLLQELN